MDDRRYFSLCFHALMIRPESLLLSSVNFNTEVPAQPLIKEHSHGVMVRRIMENIPWFHRSFPLLSSSLCWFLSVTKHWCDEVWHSNAADNVLGLLVLLGNVNITSKAIWHRMSTEVICRPVNSWSVGLNDASHPGSWVGSQGVGTLALLYQRVLSQPYFSSHCSDSAWPLWSDNLLSMLKLLENHFLGWI